MVAVKNINFGTVIVKCQGTMIFCFYIAQNLISVMNNALAVIKLITISGCLMRRGDTRSNSDIKLGFEWNSKITIFGRRDV